MVKADIILRIMEECDLNRKKSEESLESILENIKQTLKKGETVVLKKFGRFRILNKAAREGRNPKTGEAAHISARKTISFKKSKILLKKINEIDK